MATSTPGVAPMRPTKASFGVHPVHTCASLWDCMHRSKVLKHSLELGVSEEQTSTNDWLCTKMLTQALTEIDSSVQAPVPTETKQPGNLLLRSYFCVHTLHAFTGDLGFPSLVRSIRLELMTSLSSHHLPVYAS